MPARRKPASEHALNGTARSNSTNLNPLVVVDDQRLTAPSFLSKSAKREFKRIVSFLEEQDASYLTRLDSSALAAYAASFAGWAEAEAKLATDGPTIKKPVVNRSSGNVTGHIEAVSPWLAISEKRLASMLKSIAALGFDPRSRLAVDREPTKSRSDDNRSRTKQYQELVDDEDAPILSGDND